MFHRKSKADKAREEATSRARRASRAAAVAKGRAAAGARHGATTLGHTARERIGPRAGAAAGAVGAHALEYRDRAVAGLDHGIDAAVPRAEQAVAGVAPRVDAARDVIVDDLLPKITALLASVQVGKDELLAKQGGPVAAVTGAPKRRRKGGVLLALGALSAVGAGVAWYLSQQSRDQRDPWAALPEDRPIGGAPGVDNQVRQSLGTDTATTGTSTVVGGAAAVGTTADDGTASVDDTSTIPDTPRTGAGTAAGTSTAGDAPVHPLDSDEVDSLAADHEDVTDDLPPANTDATTGFGTEGSQDPDERRG